MTFSHLFSRICRKTKISSFDISFERIVQFEFIPISVLSHTKLHEPPLDKTFLVDQKTDIFLCFFETVENNIKRFIQALA